MFGDTRCQAAYELGYVDEVAKERLLDAQAQLTAARNVMGDARARTLQPVDIRIGKQFFRNVPGIEADEPPGLIRTSVRKS